jgi:hypothetical protein
VSVERGEEQRGTHVASTATDVNSQGITAILQLHSEY